MRGRQLGALVAAFVVAMSSAVVLASPAGAAAYRFWSYWHVTNGAWKFSSYGASAWAVHDGSVEGWRFAVSADSASAAQPRTAPTSAFASICGDTPASPDRKRVALVVDFGVTSDAPSGDSPPSTAVHGSCVTFGANADNSGWDTLVEAGYSIRSKNGLVCGLSGYPTSGCGSVVAAPAPTTAVPTTTRGVGTSGNGGSSGTAGRAATPAGAQASAAVSSGASPTNSTSASSTATTSASASSAPDSTASGPAESGGSTTEPTPALVEGAPAAATSGSSSSPLLAVLALLVIAGIGGAAFLRRRRRTP